jgi:hypothetical protein
MENKMATLIDSLKDISNIDEYENIISEEWNPEDEAPVVFIDLIKIINFMNINLSVLEYESMKYYCVSCSHSDKKIFYLANVRNLINYLIKNKLYKF